MSGVAEPWKVDPSAVGRLTVEEDDRVALAEDVEPAVGVACEDAAAHVVGLELRQPVARAFLDLEARAVRQLLQVGEGSVGLHQLPGVPEAAVCVRRTNGEVPCVRHAAVLLVLVPEALGQGEVADADLLDAAPGVVVGHGQGVEVLGGRRRLVLVVPDGPGGDRVGRGVTEQALGLRVDVGAGKGRQADVVGCEA